MDTLETATVHICSLSLHSLEPVWLLFFVLQRIRQASIHSLSLTGVLWPSQVSKRLPGSLGLLEHLLQLLCKFNGSRNLYLAADNSSRSQRTMTIRRACTLPIT